MRLSAVPSGPTLGVLLALAAATAGLTHAATLLGLPWRSHRDAFARVAALVPAGGRVLLPASGALPFGDASMLTAVCRYDLRERPFRMGLTPFGSGFVTLGFHTRHGTTFYGLTRRASDTIPLDLNLVAQASGKAAADLDNHVITLDAPEPEGFVAIATPAEADADQAEAQDRLAHVLCGTGAMP